MDISKHEIYKALYELSQSIEALGASPELTTIVIKVEQIGRMAERVVEPDIHLDFLGRIKNELATNGARYDGLVAFTRGDAFRALPADTQFDLLAQREAMREYLSILTRRSEKLGLV
jgi:hypothetical protein